MGAGPSPQDGGGRRVRLNVAPLDECLNEGEALAQGRYCDVPTIFAALLRQRGHQIFGDEFQLRVRVFGAKVRQLLQTGVAQTRPGSSRTPRSAGPAVGPLSPPPMPAQLPRIALR